MSNLLKRIISSILIIIILLVFLDFLKNTQNIDNFAYVVAIGLDKGSSSPLKITFQTLAPTSDSSGGSEGESSDSSKSKSSSVINTSIECSSINSGIQLVNGYIGSKQLNLSHCQSIIFSEELAYDGIAKYIYTFANNSQIHHSTNIVVSRCSAEYYLNNSESSYESLISKYYDTSPTSGKYTGYTNPITLVDFFSSLTDTYKEPTAILSSINSPSSQGNNSSNDAILKDLTVKAGQSPISTDKAGMEDIGLAVFKDDKLIGELTAMETIAHLITINEFESCELSITDPTKENATIDFSLNRHNNNKITVDIINNNPYINIDISLNIKILSMNKDENYIDNSILTKLEFYLNRYLENIMYEYLYKTSLDFGSDISSFGKFAMPKFLTTDDWNNYNWNDNYKNSIFKVNVSTLIDSSNLLLKT